MYLSTNWLAVVRRRILEIYDNTHGNFKPWRTMMLSHLVGSASFSPYTPLESSTLSLRLGISCDDGVYVYNVSCDVQRSELSMNLIWQCKPTPTPQYPLRPRFAFDVSLGVTGNTVLWLSGSHGVRTDFFTFSMAMLPSDPDDQPSIIDWFDESMPVQYFLGVRDFDEARGIAIFGNAFGELCLYDFSSSPPQDFEGCCRYMLTVFPHAGEEFLPMVRGTWLFMVYFLFDVICRNQSHPVRRHHFLTIRLFYTSVISQRCMISGNLMHRLSCHLVGLLTSWERATKTST